MDDEKMMEIYFKSQMGEGEGTVFDTGSSVDYNSGLNCRVFKKVDNSCSYICL